jgi:hypothetical protein
VSQTALILLVKACRSTATARASMRRSKALREKRTQREEIRKWGSRRWLTQA